MSHQFKPGDLALMVKAYHPENVGHCVELVDPDEAASIFAGEPCWVVNGSGPGSIAKESWLMPLRGDFQPECQQSREVPA